MVKLSTHYGGQVSLVKFTADDAPRGECQMMVEGDPWTAPRDVLLVRLSPADQRRLAEALLAREWA